MKHSLFFYLLFLTIALYSMEYDTIHFEESDPLLAYSGENYTSAYEFDKTLHINRKETKAMVFDPQDANTLYAGYSDYIVRIWDINNNSYQELPKSNEISTIAISLDGKMLATGGWRQSVTLFDITKKIITKELIIKSNKYAVDDYAQDVSCLAFSPKEKILAAGLHGDGSIYGQNINTIALFNTENYTQEVLIGPMGLRLRHISLNPHDEKELIAVSYGKVTFWDIVKKECTREVNNDINDCSYVRNITFHPLKNVFFASKSLALFEPCSRYIQMWDARQQKIVKHIPLVGFDKEGITHIVVNPNGKEIIATGHDNTQIFDLETCKLLQSLPNKRSFLGSCACSSSINRPQHNSPICEVALSNNGKNLATRGSTIKIWNRD